MISYFCIKTEDMKDSGFDAMMFGRLKAGDEAAFKCLFEHYYVPLCLYSVQITESPEDSEDIVQDFFVRFWEKGFYRTVDTNLKSYLFNAVRNLSFNYLKKQRTYLFEELEERSLSLPEECTEDDVREHHRHLHEAFRRLSPQEVRVLRGIVFEGKTYKKVAQEMGISVNTVKTYLARALKFLRMQLLLGIIFICFLRIFFSLCHPFL